MSSEEWFCQERGQYGVPKAPAGYRPKCLAKTVGSPLGPFWWNTSLSDQSNKVTSIFKLRISMPFDENPREVLLESENQNMFQRPTICRRRPLLSNRCITLCTTWMRRVLTLVKALPKAGSLCPMALKARQGDLVSACTSFSMSLDFCKHSHVDVFLNDYFIL